MSSSGVPTNIENGKLTTDLDAAGNDLINLDPGNQTFGYSYRDLSDAMSNEIDTLLTGLSAGSTSQNIYSTKNNSGSGTYVRSVTWFGADLDLTSVSVFCNETTGIGALKTITLVAPDIGISANHVGITTGKTYRFVGSDNLPVNLVVSNSAQIGSTDIQVVKFSSLAPSTITPISVLSDLTVRTFRTTAAAIFIDQNQKGYVGDLSVGDSVGVNEASEAVRAPFWKSGGIITGDSSYPIMAVIDGGVALFSTFHNPNSGDSVALYIDDINSEMTSLGSSYQLTLATVRGAGSVAELNASLTPGSGQVPIVQSSGQLDPSIVPAPGLNLTLALTLQTVSDANIASTDWTNYSTMVLTAITAPRVWTLPIAASDASLTNGSIKVIVDRSFQISNTNILTLAKGSVGSTIDNADSLVLNNPGSVVALQWNAVGGKWKILFQFAMPPQFNRLGLGMSPDATIPLSVSLNTNGVPTAGPAGTVLQCAGADGVSPILLIDAFGNAPSFTGRRANGTVSSKTTLVAGSAIAQIRAQGFDGTNYSGTQASVRTAAAETWTTIAHGAYVDFQTTPLGSTSIASVGRIQPSGGMSVGTTALLTDPGAGNLLLDGNLRQGVATGVPASAGATGVAGTFAFDTGFVYVCTATNTWKRSAISTW